MQWSFSNHAVEVKPQYVITDGILAEGSCDISDDKIESKALQKVNKGVMKCNLTGLYIKHFDLTFKSNYTQLKKTDLFEKFDIKGQHFYWPQHQFNKIKWSPGR
jgi:hypothetical protein